jgi:hypothetical protein
MARADGELIWEAWKRKRFLPQYQVHYQVSLFHDCASIPPAQVAGMAMQEFVPPHVDSDSGGLKRRLWKREWMIHVFSGVQSNNYWSSTTNAGNTDNAWNVNLNNGNVNNNNKTSNTNYVWPVRGGSS